MMAMLPEEDAYALVSKDDLLELLGVYEQVMQQRYLSTGLEPMPEQLILVRRIDSISGRCRGEDTAWYRHIGGGDWA